MSADKQNRTHHLLDHPSKAQSEARTASHGLYLLLWRIFENEKISTARMLRRLTIAEEEQIHTGASKRQILSFRSNVLKEIMNTSMSWKVFLKLLRIIGVTDLSFIVRYKKFNNIEKEVGIKGNLGKRFKSAEFLAMLEEEDRENNAVVIEPLVDELALLKDALFRSRYDEYRFYLSTTKADECHNAMDITDECYECPKTAKKWRDNVYQIAQLSDIAEDKKMVIELERIYHSMINKQ